MGCLIVEEGGGGGEREWPWEAEASCMILLLVTITLFDENVIIITSDSDASPWPRIILVPFLYVSVAIIGGARLSRCRMLFFDSDCSI
jgi:hypothetical protein